MQILLTLRPEKPLIIPLNYNYCLQSAIYAVLGEVGQSDFWHDNGFGDLTKHKGFCFSKLNGKYRIDRENKKICFENNVYLEIRSSVFDFIDSMQRALEQHPFLKLYDTRLDVAAASLQNRHMRNGNVTFTAQTPVVIHKTYTDGHTKYFSPDEDDYYIRICNNIETKYEIITGTKPDDVLLAPLGEFSKTITQYKGFYITGYTGSFAIKTSLRMAEFIYNTGLGEKNSQGFGFLDVKEDF